ncbi:MAG: hypothetical protein CMP07_07475 [Xanthomonadales bacterium]|nr:hypothetical protein [Xanthomonadales bacterium]
MQPSEIEGLEFTGREFDPDSGELRLRWRLFGNGQDMLLEERFGFGRATPHVSPDHPSFQAALDLLHWIAGVSYWKVACRGDVLFPAGVPDAFQADALAQIYRHGLAEMAWVNRLQGRYWPDFDAGDRCASADAPTLGLGGRALVPMGGGKDSLVALERVRARGIETETVQVGSAPLIGRVAERAGTRHRVIRRQLAPELASLNAAGALNGHVPITAINAATLVIAALIWNFDAVVFANERSADAPTLTTPDGRPVNHQFAKSHAFEQLLGDWIARYIADDLAVFSLLRRDSELAICREFAELTAYHDVFSSCNRNFHLDGPRTARWCGQCPKCRFVFLGLAPFMDVQRLEAIFGRDLLAEPGQADAFAELLELAGPRPFECVGEAGEARAALGALAADPRWCDHAVVRELMQRVRGIRLPDLASIVRPAGPDCIPGRFRR